MPVTSICNVAAAKFFAIFNITNDPPIATRFAHRSLEYWLYQVHQNNGIWSIIIFAFLGAAFEKLDAMGLLDWLKRRSRRANRWNASASAKREGEVEEEEEAPPSSSNKGKGKGNGKKKKKE